MPVRTKNPLNLSTGNSRVAAIIRTQKGAKERASGAIFARAALAKARVAPTQLVPCVVTFTRLSTAKMDDEGCIASLKHYRDGIADALGVDDGSRFIKFEYAQLRGKRGQHAVHVRIERRNP